MFATPEPKEGNWKEKEGAVTALKNPGVSV